MRRLLLVMPNYYGFDEVVYDGLVKYSGHQVYKLNYDVGFKYHSYWQRIYNFFSKTFLKKNLKDKYKEAYFVKYLDSIGSFDMVIVNRPDILPVGLLNKLTEEISNSRLVLWDSLRKIPIHKEIIKKFKITYSFDTVDCCLNDFSPINNFYFESDKQDSEVEYDTVFLGTLDDRIANLQVILKKLSDEGLKVKAYLHIPKNRKLNDHTNIEVLRGIIPFKDSAVFTKNSKVVLDIAHRNQVGLSFRFFEAMGLRKKVITTNAAVRKYDFFNESNIFVIDDIKNISIPSSFWSEEYEELPSSIFEKYSLNQWVQKIVE